MSEITILQMPMFKRAYKKLHADQKSMVDGAIKTILDNPEIGELKTCTLSGVYVYKFKVNNQTVLLAYEFIPKTITLLAVGSHENFYRDLEKNRKQ